MWRTYRFIHNPAVQRLYWLKKNILYFILDVSLLLRLVANRARNCKRLGRPWIDSADSIPPAYVSWRAGTTNRVVVPARWEAGNRYLGSLKGLHIRALGNGQIGDSLYRCPLPFSGLNPPLSFSGPNPTTCFQRLWISSFLSRPLIFCGPNQTAEKAV